MEWPSKAARERFEIERLPNAHSFRVLRKSEGPDYVLLDTATDQEFGVELTSVYLDDRSVPDNHIPDRPGITRIPYCKSEMTRYCDRIVAKAKEKVQKARSWYSLERPLILSMYLSLILSMYL